MIIFLSKTLSLVTSYLHLRGKTYQFRLRVPQDLLDRYPTPIIRKSLKTSNEREAVAAANRMHAQYQATFSVMRGNVNLTPADTLRAAQALADSLPPLELDNFYFSDKFDDYVRKHGIDEETLRRNPDMVKDADYLNPVDLKALQLLQGETSTPRLSAALEIYISLYPNTSNKKALERVRRDWKQLMDITGDIAITDLTREHGRMFIADCLARGMKTTSAQRAIGTLSAVLNKGITELEVRGAVNPFSKVSIANKGKDSKTIKTASPQELKDILTKFSSDTSDPALLVLMQMGLGCRIAEVSGLALADVVLDGETPHINIQERPWRTLKNETSKRLVPLVGFALDAAKVAVENAQGGEALFKRYAKESGNTNASATINRHLKPWGIGTHGFRHAMKDLLRESGCPEAIQKEIQGHAGDGVASNYGKGYSLRTQAEWLQKAQALITTATTNNK